MPVAAPGRHDEVAEGGARLADHAVLARARQSGGRKRRRSPWPQRCRGRRRGARRRRGYGERGVEVPRASAASLSAMVGGTAPEHRTRDRALCAWKASRCKGMGDGDRRSTGPGTGNASQAKQPTSMCRTGGVLGCPRASRAPPVEDGAGGPVFQKICEVVSMAPRKLRKLQDRNQAIMR